MINHSWLHVFPAKAKMCKFSTLYFFVKDSFHLSLMILTLFLRTIFMIIEFSYVKRKKIKFLKYKVFFNALNTILKLSKILFVWILLWLLHSVIHWFNIVYRILLMALDQLQWRKVSLWDLLKLMISCRGIGYKQLKK